MYLQDTETQNSYKRSGNGRGGYLIGRGHINGEIWYTVYVKGIDQNKIFQLLFNSYY